MAKKAKSKKTKSLQSLQSIMNKYSQVSLASEMYGEVENMPWLPSRSLVMNWVTGGGIPFGKVLELFGQESSGKSLVALDFLAICQKLGGWGMWVDAESSYSKDWWTTNGIDLDKVLVFHENAIEVISDWTIETARALRKKLTHNEPILYVLDSIAALDTIERLEMEQTDEKAEMGIRAKAMGNFLRKRSKELADLGVTCIFINQLRKKLGTMFEDPETTPGGEAMKFFAHIRMGFYRKKQIKEKVHGKETWVGNYVSMRMKKNKVAPPRPTVETEVYFLADYCQPGFSRYAGLAEVLESSGAVKREKGSSIYYDNDGNKIARGEDAFQSLLEENKDIRSKLIKLAGINTFSNTKKVLEDLNEKEINLFPVGEEEE